MRIARKEITIPRFRTEAAEAEWWDGHPEAAAEIMKRALKSAKARRRLHEALNKERSA